MFRAPGGSSALGGNRTPNLLIRSQMLYPLSYERSVKVDRRVYRSTGSPGQGVAMGLVRPATEPFAARSPADPPRSAPGRFGTFARRRSSASIGSAR